MAPAPRQRGPHPRPIEGTSELDLASQLNARLDMVDALCERWERVGGVRINPRSEMGHDDAHTAWRHLSHTVTLGLNVATDNLRAFRDLVRRDEQLIVPQFAHYPVLRAALEGASLSLWLLAPDDPRDRIGRLLRAAMAEIEDEARLVRQVIRAIADDPDNPSAAAESSRATAQSRATTDEHIAQLRRIADRVGLTDPTKAKRAVGYAEIVRAATSAAGTNGYYGETVWRMISGLAHPSLMRAVTRSTVEELTDNGDGTFHALVTTDLGLTRTALEAACMNTKAALDLYGARKIRPADPAAYVSTG
jgi:hypothetical protein